MEPIILVVVGLLTSTVGGIIALMVAATQPRKRRDALLLAAPLFLPVAILGDRPIGTAFLAVTVSCLLGAVVTHRNASGSGTPKA